jgi:hypothetical protein
MISIYKDPWSVAAARDAPLAGSPLSERPNVYASLPAMSAVAYLGIPASAELIEALVRCFLPAIAAEGKKALWSVPQQNFVAPCDIRVRPPPVSERRKHALPMV